MTKGLSRQTEKKVSRLQELIDNLLALEAALREDLEQEQQLRGDYDELMMPTPRSRQGERERLGCVSGSKQRL